MEYIEQLVASLSSLDSIGIDTSPLTKIVEIVNIIIGMIGN